eukprot:TRINITY_DN10920_c0_g2_i7.p1 TRINITY_DN10920_c0_g2~~TRINITY_DN10920_c0_g2_i7.p1  ORF type:complete len:265 (+),score=114.29 TRINITY_DN10920_c0_g2_i7:204-998(+)
MGCGADRSSKNDNNCIIIVGAPASGKGTQAEKIKAKYNFLHISSGDLLRAEIKKDTDLGKKAKEFMEKGELVPDELIIEMIDGVISKQGNLRIMFDGFPRTLEQSKQLDEMLKKRNKKLVAVVYLDVPDSELVERGTGRRIHLPSGRSYHVKFNPPKVEGKDDKTGEDLVQREDDKEETIKKRLEEFHKNNDRVVEHYEAQGVVFKVQANEKIEAVWGKVMEVLDKALTPEDVGEPKPRKEDAKEEGGNEAKEEVKQEEAKEEK